MSREAVGSRRWADSFSPTPPASRPRCPQAASPGEQGSLPRPHDEDLKQVCPSQAKRGWGKSLWWQFQPPKVLPQNLTVPTWSLSPRLREIDANIEITPIKAMRKHLLPQIPVFSLRNTRWHRSMEAKMCSGKAPGPGSDTTLLKCDAAGLTRMLCLGFLRRVLAFNQR